MAISSILANVPTQHDKREDGEIHTAICDVCDFDIIGIRWKCLNCADYDLCQYCEEKIFESRCHPLHHVFIKLETPVPLTQPPFQFNVFPNLYTGQVDTANNHLTDGNIVHENLFCSNCKHPIIGSRFCCTVCDFYSLCESCESKHCHRPSSHTFIKIRFCLPLNKTTYKVDPYGSATSPQSLASSSSSLRSSQIILSKSGTLLRKPKSLAISQKGTRISVTLRPIEISDVPAVYEIEKESFHTPYDYEFFYEFSHAQNSHLIVAVRPDNVIGGYIAYSIRKRGRVIVVSVAVASHSRRMGIAQQLMKKAILFAYQSGCEIYLQVSVMNFPAQHLYLSLGFQVKKWIKNYYQSEGEDALVMVHSDVENWVTNNIESLTQL